MSGSVTKALDFLGLAAGGLGLRLLGQKHSLDVGQHTTLGDGDAGQKLVQLLVVADGELKVTGDDPRLLVVAGSVACQLEHLSGQVLEHGGQVHGCTGADTLSVVALAQETVDSPHGELKSGTGRAGLALSLNLASFAASRHDEKLLRGVRAPHGSKQFQGMKFPCGARPSI